MKKQDLRNRTFFLGLISFILSITSLLILFYLFLGIKKYNSYINILFRLSIISIIISFVLGICGLIKAKNCRIGKIFCIFPITIFSIISFICILSYIELTFPHKISKKKDIERTSELLKIDLSGGKYLKRIENHSGFLGDGDYYAQIKFDDSVRIIESIENNNNWKKTPLPKSILYILNDDEENDRFSFNIDKKMFFPKMKDGYYFFLNRSDEFEEPENKNPDFIFTWKWSYNFSIALFDLDTCILYLYELDT